MVDPTPRRRGRPARQGWKAFPLSVPPEVDDAVREIAAHDVMAPSLNAVYVALLREALAARGARKKP